MRVNIARLSGDTVKSAYGPLRHLMPRTNMSEFGGKLEVVWTPQCATIDPLQSLARPPGSKSRGIQRARLSLAIARLGTL